MCYPPNHVNMSVSLGLGVGHARVANFKWNKAFVLLCLWGSISTTFIRQGNALWLSHHVLKGRLNMHLCIQAWALIWFGEFSVCVVTLRICWETLLFLLLLFVYVERQGLNYSRMASGCIAVMVTRLHEPHATVIRASRRCCSPHTANGCLRNSLSRLVGCPPRANQFTCSLN